MVYVAIYIYINIAKYDFEDRGKYKNTVNKLALLAI